MSKCRNVPVIIPLCVRNPVPEWSGFATWAFHMFKMKVKMSKCRNVPIIILLCVKNPVPERSGFTTWAFHVFAIFQLIGYLVFMFSVELLFAIGF